MSLMRERVSVSVFDYCGVPRVWFLMNVNASAIWTGLSLRLRTMTMAYYPGNYYHHYSRDLFDPYSTDSYYRDDDHDLYPPLPSLPPEHSSPPSSPSKSPLPPPLPAVITPPPAARPSPSYLALASEPSKTLPEPTRKLLILDLNGTLLLRSPRPAKSSRSQYQSHAAPRRVMPRPYLSALRAYLFAPQTRAWLDVMVWSSAQPHSVEDMVSCALGDDREWLVAIWARDTLGLAKDHYCASFLSIFPSRIKTHHHPLCGIRDKKLFLIFPMIFYFVFFFLLG
jgi:hypothetical protein